MAYAEIFTFHLGSSKAGLTIDAQVVDTAGSDVGSLLTDAAVDLGGGTYSFYYAAFTDAFVGSVVFTDQDTDEVLLSLPVAEPLQSLYHADIQFTVDASNSQDEYTVIWFRNGTRVTSGITVPVITATVRSNGSDLFTAEAMTQVGSTGAYKYDATGDDRQTSGNACLIVVAATIGGGSRSFARVVGRDSQ